MRDYTEFGNFHIKNEKIVEPNDEENFTDNSNSSYNKLRILADNGASSSNLVFCSIPISEKFSTETSSYEDKSFSEPKSDLKELLESTFEGRALLLHHKTKCFENVHRQRLVRIICARILKKSPQKKISAEEYQKWTDEILNLFPEENKSVYLREREHKKGHQVFKRLGGKLIDCIHNLKRRYRKNEKHEIEDEIAFEDFHIRNENLVESDDGEDLTGPDNSGFSLDMPFSEPQIDLKKLLNSTLQGKALLLHDKTKSFENIHRKQLVNIISARILEKKPEKSISEGIYQKWVNELLHLFPREKKSVYLSKKTKIKGSQVITRLGGKLPDRVHNLKRKYRQDGIITYRKRTYRRTSSNAPSSNPFLKPSLWRFPKKLENISDPEGAKESLLYLKSLSSSWAATKTKWPQTVHIRLVQLKDMSLHDYFNEYPPLKKPLGYQLLKSDFEFVYPASANSLSINLPSIKKRIFDIASKKNYPNLKDLLKLIGVSDETSNLATFLLIPTLISITTWYNGANNKRWRPSKVEVREGFITHVRRDAEIRRMLSQRRKQLLDLQLTLQPFIIIVGPSLEEIKTYYVVVNETMYALPNILEAVDTCFKAIFMLNAEYPAVCHSTWMFIQAAFYKITISSDQMSTATNTLLGDLGILD